MDVLISHYSSHEGIHMCWICSPETREKSRQAKFIALPRIPFIATMVLNAFHLLPAGAICPVT